MPVRIFTVPFDAEEMRFRDEDFQGFCLNKAIRHLQSEFFTLNGIPYWTILIQYDTTILKDDATAALAEPERKLFEHLQQWRKEKALSEGIPVYIIATNKELTELITRAPKTLDGLKSIKGFGKQKVSRYGKEMLDLINKFYERKIQEREAV